MRVGVDVVEVPRFARAVRRWQRLPGLIFNGVELDLAGAMPPSRRDHFLAGRFAVKEAVRKALLPGNEQWLPLPDIEVGRGQGGEPVVRYHGVLQERFSHLGLTATQVTISHDAGIAVAVAILM